MTNVNQTPTPSKLILRNLLKDEKYTRRVLPYLKQEYFRGAEQIVFKTFDDYMSSYNKLPNDDSLIVTINAIPGYKDEQVTEAAELVASFDNISAPSSEDWLIDITRAYIKDQAMTLAMVESLTILNEPKKSKKTKEAIPDMLREALAADLDSNIGHNYFDDAESRWDEKHKPESRLKFNVDKLNEITKGGLATKRVLIYIGGINVGKSLCMCANAADFLSNGANVLYITLEMPADEVAQRIDANLLNITVDDLDLLPKANYLKLVSALKQKIVGQLYIKEYGSNGASASTVRSLLQELKLKRKFVPDVIFIDYLGIFASSYMNPGQKITNSYGYVKSVTEEIHALAKEFDTRIISAVQFNREGFNSSDPDMDNTAESFGLPAAIDHMIAIVSNDGLQATGQYLFKQIKNRYGSKLGGLRKFLVGVDYEHMKLYNVSQKAISEGEGHAAEETGVKIPAKKSFTDKTKFKGFKT